MTAKKGATLHEDYETFMNFGEPVTPQVAKQYTPDGKGGWTEVGTIPLGQNTPLSPQQLLAEAKKKYCSHSQDFAYITAGGIELYGSTSYSCNPAGFDIAIDLGRSKPNDMYGAIDRDDRIPSGIMEGPADFLTLNEHLLKVPKFIDIVWVDYQVPLYLGYDFWFNFAKKIEESGAKQVLVACMGGHGRTGTCLAILGGMLDDQQGAVMIPTIRKNYCNSAIENMQQEDYVTDVLAGKY